MLLLSGKETYTFSEENDQLWRKLFNQTSTPGMKKKISNIPWKVFHTFLFKQNLGISDTWLLRFIRWVWSFQGESTITPPLTWAAWSWLWSRRTSSSWSWTTSSTSWQRTTRSWFCRRTCQRCATYEVPSASTPSRRTLSGTSRRKTNCKWLSRRRNLLQKQGPPPPPHRRHRQRTRD